MFFYVYWIGNRVKKILYKVIDKMFFNVVCYCGMPICDLYRYYILAKLLTFQDQSTEIEQAVQKIRKEFSEETYQYVFEFIHVSFDHLNIF